MDYKTLETLAFLLIGSAILVGAHFLLRPRTWGKTSADVTSVLWDSDAPLIANYSFRPEVGQPGRDTGKAELFTGSDSLPEPFLGSWTTKGRQAHIDTILAKKLDVWYAVDDPTLNYVKEPNNYMLYLGILLTYISGYGVLIYSIVRFFRH
jgi:hypothetical protein